MTSPTWPKRLLGRLLAGWGVVAVLTIVATWQGGIAVDLMYAVLAVVGLFTTNIVLPFTVDWLDLVRHAFATALAFYIAAKTLRYQRISRGTCGRCGRTGAPRRDYRRLARAVSLAAIVPAAGYATLKLYWGFGGTGGLIDPSAFAAVKPWSPGFGDTAIMAAIGVAVGIAMAYRWWRLPGWMLLTPAVLGCVMLLPIGVGGTIANVASLVVGEARPPMADWVYWVVYGSFALWGAGLAIVTLEFRSATGRACRTCGRGVPGSTA